MTVNIIRTPDDLIHVTAGFGTDVTPDEADSLARWLNDLAKQIRRDAARAVCAVDGHMWWGFNAYRWGDLKNLIHIRYCERDHCDLREESDGWRDTVYPRGDA